MNRDEIASAVKKKYAACMASPSVWDDLIDLEWRNAELEAAAKSSALTSDQDIVALEQILDYAQKEEGKSQGGYFSSGWAGSQLRALLERARRVNDVER